jgi:hypothetical protein
MRSFAILALAATVLSLTGGNAAHAREYPWCARYDAWAYNCGFTTFQQCQATISGAGGICEHNPRAGSAEAAPYSGKRKPVRR